MFSGRRATTHPGKGGNKMIGKSPEASWLYKVLFGALGSILLGAVFFGTAVFHRRHPAFAFTGYGIAGAVVFPLVQGRRSRDAGFAVVAFFLLNLLLAGTRFWLTQLLFYGAAVVSVYLFAERFYRPLGKIPAARPLVLAGLFAIGFILDTLILAAVYHGRTGGFLPFRNLPVGFLIGLGLGIGFELAEYVIAGKERRTVKK